MRTSYGTKIQTQQKSFLLTLKSMAIRRNPKSKMILGKYNCKIIWMAAEEIYPITLSFLNKIVIEQRLIAVVDDVKLPLKYE